MLNFFNFWFPWVIFFNDIWILQLIIVYLVFLIILTKNNYYLLLYLFIEIILFGLYLGLIQGELFTGFLWVLEFTVIFIMLIFLFYLNIDGYGVQINLNYNFFFLGFFFFWLTSYFYYVYVDLSYLNLFNYVYLWDDYYEAFYNKVMNDFVVLTISYYSFNNFELLILGLFLLVGSVICVLLNKKQHQIKLYLLGKVNYLLNYLMKFNSFWFLRKQNLTNQANFNPSLRMFNKKK